MDPNEALRIIRVYMDKYARHGDMRGWDGEEIYTAFAGLDDWLKRGGFLPTDWRSKKPREAIPGESRDDEIRVIDVPGETLLFAVVYKNGDVHIEHGDASREWAALVLRDLADGVLQRRDRP